MLLDTLSTSKLAKIPTAPYAIIFPTEKALIVKACLKCAAICDHCASSCAEEEEVKMMSKWIRPLVEMFATVFCSPKITVFAANSIKLIFSLLNMGIMQLFSKIV